MEKIFSLWEVGDLLRVKKGNELPAAYNPSPRLVLGVVMAGENHSSLYNGKNEDGIIYQSLDIQTGSMIESYLHGWVWEKADG